MQIQYTKNLNPGRFELGTTLSYPKILHKHCFQFLLRVKMAPRETENNAYAKFWGDKQRALWYVMVFFWSGQYCICHSHANKAV